MKLKIAVITGAVLAAIAAPWSWAADHLDAPATKADPAADINDVYAWVNADGTMVNLAMTVFPAAGTDAAFSDQVQYVFHLNSSASFGAAATESLLICQFDTDQTIHCWLDDDDYVKGSASDPAGLTSMKGMFKVFAGLRDDPFFFNLDGYKATVATVVSAAPNLQFDAAGCPALDAATSSVLVGQLGSGPQGAAAQDFFAPLNALAIVAQVDKAAVALDGPILGVWGSTHQR